MRRSCGARLSARVILRRGVCTYRSVGLLGCVCVCPRDDTARQRLQLIDDHCAHHRHAIDERGRVVIAATGVANRFHGDGRLTLQVRDEVSRVRICGLTSSASARSSPWSLGAERFL